MAGEDLLSIKPAVEFLNLQEQYSYIDDLICSFKFNDYSPQEGDRIAIFKLGWNFIKDYVVFEWVPTESHINFVTFNHEILPKNTTDLYQICYITGEKVSAASSTFQFVPGCVYNFATNSSQAKTTMATQNPLVKNLKEENEILRESLKAMINQKHVEKRCMEDLSEIWNVIGKLNSTVDILQKEVDMLKTKIIEGGEEYKKLYVEKMHVERKYEKLKSQKKQQDATTTKSSSKEGTFEIDDLRSIPPFPFPDMGMLK